ncbi:TonB-dependent receptor [Sphingomonas sp. DT-204]|uniref:TonB-dependent receptor n=1 Tax=Sphingomonas sp. DT-204 TaxID=3396166 RepID=UPI003F1DF6F2
MSIVANAKRGLIATTAVIAIIPSGAALAQTTPAPAADPQDKPAPTQGAVAAQPPLDATSSPDDPDGAAGDDSRGGFEDIVVTATKRGEPQNVQAVPFAVTAFGSKQLEESHFTNLQSLSYKMPNVSLGQAGTTPGYANFSIRGLGINSSIPSIDPTVGVFVDGTYLGVSAGLVFGNFDLEGLEVLRGPQGLLFGRNVTGGAVVLRTTTPSNTFHADLSAQISTGPEYRATAVVTGPLVKDMVQAKIAVYYNKDEGYFHNEFNGNDHLGESRTFIVRPALRLSPDDRFEMILRYEFGEYDGDGAVATNHGLYPIDSFGVNIDNEGFAHNHWHMASIETNVPVSIGDGTITNIMSYRNYYSRVSNDIDASPELRFNGGNTTDQRQMSEELRYAGTFNNLDVTTGLYYFYQQIDYVEERILNLGATHLAGGGRQRQNSYGIFASFDWHFSPSLTLNVGGRYTYETKAVRVANLVANGCNYALLTCNFTFTDDNGWGGFTPRVGVQWKPDDQTQVYAFWTKGFRSGGYNFRNVFPAVAPGPFDDEVQSSYEIGVKKDVGRILRINAAAFWNQIDNVQREIQIPVVGVGTSQQIVNAANARVRGVEGEVTLRPGAGFTISGQFGYTEGNYTDVLFDLNNDRVINELDFGLQLPRLAPWTYGASLGWTHQFDDINISANISINHNDAQWYNDANTGRLRAADMLDANLALRRGPYTVSLYGTNLLDVATYSAEAPLAFFAGSTFAPLNKGRVIGASISAKF